MNFNDMSSTSPAKHNDYGSGSHNEPVGQLAVAYRIIKNALDHAAEKGNVGIHELKVSCEQLKAQNEKLQNQLRSLEGKRMETQSAITNIETMCRRIHEETVPKEQMLNRMKKFKEAIKDVCSVGTTDDVPIYGRMDSNMSTGTYYPYRAPMSKHYDTQLAPQSPSVISDVASEMGHARSFVDAEQGRVFFKQAKLRMTIEQFTTLIGAVKLLNQGMVRAEEVMDRVSEYFPDSKYKDLREEFSRLLQNRIAAQAAN